MSTTPAILISSDGVLGPGRETSLQGMMFRSPPAQENGHIYFLVDGCQWPISSTCVIHFIGV